MRFGDMDRDEKLMELVPLPDGLYTVSQRAIHRTQLADMIDPDRAYPNTPHVNQRFASSGADNPIVSRTFLQAHQLFRKPHFNEDLGGQVMSAVLAGTQEMLGAEDTRSADELLAPPPALAGSTALWKLPSRKRHDRESLSALS